MQGFPRLFLLMLLVVVLALAACGVSPSRSLPPATAPTVVPPPPVVTQGLGPDPNQVTPETSPESTVVPQP